MTEQELFELYKKHSKTEFYGNRVNQIEKFVPLAKDIIIETLNKSNLRTDDFNGFIQMFKAGCTKDTFLKYLRQNIENQSKLLEFEERFDAINVGGLTGTGLGSIQTEIDINSIEKLKAVLLKSTSIKTKNEAIKIHKEISDLNLPYIKEAVYTPWLYYLNPTIFPIQNSSIKSFLKELKCKYDYVEIIEKFHNLKEFLKIIDYGYIDSLAHEFSKLTVSDEKTLISALEEVGYENANNLYILSDKLITELKIENGDERVHYNCNAKENFNITIGQRYCIELSVKHKNFGIILPKQIDIPQEKIGFEFDGQPDAIFLRTQNFNDIFIYENDFVQSSEKELQRTQKSGFRKFTNLAFEKSIFDLEYRNELFNQVFEQDFINSIGINKNTEAKKVNMPINQILFGPPGTGKTYHTINKAVEIADNEFYNKNIKDRKELKRKFKELKESNQVVFTTFHQSMSYEEFLESLKPFEKDEKVYYKIEKGIFKVICEKAEEKPTENFVLIIDEINRGNIASIFGELITLIEPDKRKGEDEELSVTLPYSKQDFTVPKNLYIIGTMNTADRSVEALDSALRRRFVFEEMPPRHNLKEISTDFFGINLQEVLRKINLRIEKLIDKDHKIGHSYFMNLKTEINLQNAFKNKIIPLLEEYFYGDYAKIGLVLGKSFLNIEKGQDNVFMKLDENDVDYSDFENGVIYKTIVPENIDEFINAVKNIYL